MTRLRRRLVILATAVFVGGCVSDEVSRKPGPTVDYQQRLSRQGAQKRLDTEGSDDAEPLGLIRPHPGTAIRPLEGVEDPNTGRRVYELTITDTLTRTLANSPEIRVVSFDPEIAQQDITQKAAEFDLTAFGQTDYEQQDNPANSVIEPGQADNRSLQTGVKQKITTGAEWSASFALTRRWDDLTIRTLSTRHEPVLTFTIRQPLLRDAWETVTLAGVNVARLNHEITVEGFRRKAEEVAAGAMVAYWALYQARRNHAVQQELYDRTDDTLRRLLNRASIDATSVQLKQAEASLKAREAALLQAEQRVFDAQDALLRLMSDSQLNLTEDIEVVPATDLTVERADYETDEILAVAMRNSPLIRQRKIALTIANVNLDVANHQKMPRLDFFVTGRTQSLAREHNQAARQFSNADYVSYTAGLTLEYPIGNRYREAEVSRRRLERLRATSDLHAMADQVSKGVKDALRSAETKFKEIEVQAMAVEAARTHLSTLEDAESIRERLTPEFLFVKLQAQESLADAERAEVAALVEYNVSLVQIAQAAGTVLQLHQVGSAMSESVPGDGEIRDDDLRSVP